MKVTHIRMKDGIKDIRVEVEDEHRRFPVKVSVSQEGNDMKFSGANLFVLEKDFDERVRKFAIAEIAKSFK